MKQLTKLQHTFQDCVLRPNNPASRAWVSASGRAAPEIQLSIYTHAYSARLKEVLANDYPAMLMAIGEDRFYQLADDYIQAHPSHYFSLRDFGSQLPGFVSDGIQHDARYQDVPWLYELALFEWTLGQAFDAADATRLSEQDLASVPADAWPELIFIIHPSVHRLALEWNIPELWQALTAETPRQVVAQREAASPWLIWREQLVTRFRSMLIDEQRALDTLADKATFDEVCEVLTTLMSEDQIPMHVAGLLKGWITQGIISRMQLSN